jgi:DNA-binding transcriptional LysR family regulator
MDLLGQMEMLVLVVEKGTLAAAARQLGVSSAAVSKQLSKLEAYLNVQLLIRSTRHLELTEVGRSYYEQCKRILEEVAESTAFISEMKQEPHGRLKVVSARHFGMLYIVPYLQEFLNLYPHVQLDLELAERMPDLESEGIDIVIGMSLSASEHVIQKRIAKTRYVLCASPAYFKQFGKPLNPSDLKNHRYITHSMRSPDDILFFQNKEAVKLTPYLRINDTETMAKLALQGLGMVKLHHYVVKQELEQGELETVLDSYMEPDIPIFVAFLPRRYISNKIRCFIDFIVQKIGSGERLKS